MCVDYHLAVFIRLIYIWNIKLFLTPESTDIYVFVLNGARNLCEAIARMNLLCRNCL